jgi:fibrillarin-like rRNA methylase
MADKRFNIVPIVYGSPYQYRMLINIVDVLFAAPDRPEEVTFLSLLILCFES